MTAFEALAAHDRETCALEQVMGRLRWDQEVMMPRGAGAQRAEEMAALETVLHARRSDTRIGDWLAAAEAPDAAGAALLRLIRRDFDRQSRVPLDLAAEIARTASLSHDIWAEARAREDTAHFLPILKRMVTLKREEAAALAAGGDRYDALLDEYEPGTTGADIAAMFNRMRPRLRALRNAALAAPRQPAPLLGEFERETQMRIARILAEVFGYDFQRGRLDLAVHPFSSGSGDDVRISTRILEADPFNCFYSTIHEVGHAAYEQNIDRAFVLSRLGRGVSMGVHESQARFYENQIGRSWPFCAWLFEKMRGEFGDFGIAGPEEFYATVNRLAGGFIRTEADEVQYNLHIMMRFDLERALIAGDLQVGDLEAAWNDRFEADFGYEVDRPSHGMLQDVHWAVGLFGYFPTYSLGNVYAGCLMQALCADLPGLDAKVAQGDPGSATAWLREKVQVHGGLREPRATVARACGFEPHEGPLLDYLEAKFSRIYAL